MEKTVRPRLPRRGKILQLTEVTSVAAEYVELDNLIANYYQTLFVGCSSYFLSTLAYL